MRAGAKTYTYSRRINAGKLARGAPPKRHLLWRAIRILRTFTVRELMAVTEYDHFRSVSEFVRVLRVAGYLRVQYGRAELQEPARYTLIKNTGPECPAVLRGAKALYDFNTHQEVSLVTK